MQLFYTDLFELPLPAGHRFPMSKYRLLRERLVADPFFSDDVFLIPPAATLEQITLAHDHAYVDRVVRGELSEAEQKRIGFPWTEAMVERSRRSSGATLAAADAALAEGVSVNLAGGTHHAMREAGEGYCIFNDAAITMLEMLRRRRIRRGVVIDLDVHQGNGTAQILAGSPEVFTLSVHCAKNFPARKHPSSLDVDLDIGTTDDVYLHRLSEAMAQVDAFGPYDLAIYLAGADPYEGDRLGNLKLTQKGLSMRDHLVFDWLERRSVPVAVAMAGGYAHQVEKIVDIHHATIGRAKEHWLRCRHAFRIATR
jgi:acetoin utilization deacetylase AcuC-like enzyme